MDYWIDGLVRAEPAAPNSSRKNKKLTENGIELKARRPEDFVATFVATFVVPILNRDFDKVGDEGWDKRPESELLARADSADGGSPAASIVVQMARATTPRPLGYRSMISVMLSVSINTSSDSPKKTTTW
jgi:hypothetical protein